eukprot:2421497-Amphidinium_carterae.1
MDMYNESRQLCIRTRHSDPVQQLHPKCMETQAPSSSELAKIKDDERLDEEEGRPCSPAARNRSVSGAYKNNGYSDTKCGEVGVWGCRKDKLRSDQGADSPLNSVAHFSMHGGCLTQTNNYEQYALRGRCAKPARQKYCGSLSVDVLVNPPELFCWLFASNGTTQPVTIDWSSFLDAQAKSALQAR